MDQASMIFGLAAGLAGLLACGATATFASADTGVAPEKPIATVRGLRDYFASCYHPPGLAANTRITFYFSLNNRGGIIGQPRTTWLGFNGAEQERLRQLSSFRSALDRCLPVALDRRMAATIPGEVYFLQFVVGANGKDDQVLFRPFGSHGGIDVLPSVGPGFVGAPEPESPQPAIRAFRPTRPPTRSFVRPPIALPFRGSRDLVR